MSSFYHRTDCRLCHSTKLTSVLKLPSTPPANAFVSLPTVQQEVFPLEVFKCETCGHYQLLDVVDPEILFKDYCYVSGTSPVFRRHFRNYACEVVSTYDPAPGDLVVEIGSNDGTLLKEFQKHGLKVVGVEPAQNLAKQANEDGVQTIPQFFDMGTASRIVGEFGKAKIVCGNNVFAHIDDLDSVVDGVKYLLAEGGVFVFEVQYLPELIRGMAVDMIYSEHLDYWHITPMCNFFERHQMEIQDIKFIRTHGGSIRVYVQKADKNCGYELHERWSHNPQEAAIDFNFAHFRANIKERKRELLDMLSRLHEGEAMIAGYGAPAKLTSLCYTFGLDSNFISCVYEDSPLKVGLFTPGLHIPVRSSKQMYQDKPDYVVVFAWNFADSIIKNHQEYLKQGGHFIVPLPELRIVSK